MTRVTALACVLVLAACGDNLDVVVVDKPAACGLDGAGAVKAVSAVDRKIVGAAAPYAADLTMQGRADELATSASARRQAAWQVVARALTPVPLAERRLADAFGGQPTVPAWQTWYAKDDLSRLFQKLYRDLGVDGRRVRAPFTDDAVSSAFAWNARAVEELPTWPEERYLAYLAAIDEDPEVGGVAGIHHVGYSPGAARAVLGSYAKALTCANQGLPAPWVDEPVRPSRVVLRREVVDDDSCGWTELGPYVVASGASLTVTTVGDGDADLYVRRGAPPTVREHDCRSDGDAAAESCVVEGGGPVYVAVFSATASTVDVAVTYTEADARDPACTAGELPPDAVLIKADWRRAQFGETLATYDTSDARMAVRLRADGKREWGPGDGQADPRGDAIYTVKTPAESTYRLAGLHIMSKELEHWMWITLWWSPEPDTDFGADRPAAIGGVWRNYKMCVVTDYAEGDAAAGAGNPSWCSNPYIESGEGNAATNCIGCHQHGGTDLTPETILADPRAYPHQGRTRVRNNFATDYLWALRGGHGDDLSSMFQAEVDYWDAVE